MLKYKKYQDYLTNHDKDYRHALYWHLNLELDLELNLTNHDKDYRHVELKSLN
jgi:hypothetical protein